MEEKEQAGQTPRVDVAAQLRHAFSPGSLRWFALLNLGLLLTAAGTHFFKSPNHFAIGGTTGLSIILADILPGANVGSMMFAINTLLVVIGLIFLGRKAIGSTIYSSFALSAYISLLDVIWPMQSAFTQDTMLELCYAVILPAAGSAIVFNLGASTGGTDIVAMILAQKTSLEIGRALLIRDSLITLWAGTPFGIPIGLYCVLGLLARAFVVDGVIDGINQRKKVTIVSKEAEAIRGFILEKLNRSATVHTAYGAYSHREIEELTTVLTRAQAVALRNYIRRIDPGAFITIVNTSETMGKGFRAV